MNVDAETLVERLGNLLGLDGLVTEAAALEAARWDISGAGEGSFLALCRPGTVEELQEVVRLACAADVAVVPRGGAQSYTGGIWPPADRRAVAVDLRRLNRVDRIDTFNGTVTVEAGCTWARLYEALSAQGVRTPFFGPLSGIKATIGGTLSQNGAFFGSSRFGPAAESVLGLDVVAADGILMRTGSASMSGIGPLSRLPACDLTSLFIGDAGALGIKARATLKVMALPEQESYASLSFEREADLLDAMVTLAGSGVQLSEVWGFDPGTHRALAASGFSKLEQAQMVGQVLRGRQGVFEKMRGIFRAGVGGGSAFVADLEYSLHLVAEGEKNSAVETIARAVDRVKRFRAKSLPDTIPRVTRAKPFRPIKALIAHDGALWLPVHGIVGVADAARLASAVDEVLEDAAPILADHGIRLSRLYALAGNLLIFEPQFFWKDRPTPFHQTHVSDTQFALASANAADPAATAAVKSLRRRVVEVMDGAGAMHFQSGRTYLMAERLDPINRNLLRTIKQFLDPKGLINPGVTTV